MMVIGLLGFGTVGGGVYKLADARTDMTVKYVLDLRQIPELGDKLVHDFAAIVNDPEVDTVVEVLGGLHPSYEFVTAALRAGKNVVTANKIPGLPLFYGADGAGQGVRRGPALHGGGRRRHPLAV